MYACNSKLSNSKKCKLCSSGVVISQSQKSHSGTSTAFPQQSYYDRGRYTSMSTILLIKLFHSLKTSLLTLMTLQYDWEIREKNKVVVVGVVVQRDDFVRSLHEKKFGVCGTNECTCTIDGASKCAYHTTAVPISALDESMPLSINTRSVYRKTESNSIPAFTIMVAKKCDPPNAQLWKDVTNHRCKMSDGYLHHQLSRIDIFYGSIMMRTMYRYSKPGNYLQVHRCTRTVCLVSVWIWTGLPTAS